MSRRWLIARLGALTSLLALGQATSAFAGSAGGKVSRLVSSIDELSAALRGDLISVADWRVGIARLLAQVSEHDLMAGIDFETLSARISFAKLGVSTANIDFGLQGPKQLGFIPKLFAVDVGRSIIPHGHANMVSAHLPLSGAFRLRQYDQVSRDENALYIRPTEDRLIGPGDVSSIGEDDDNVHWFIAEKPSYTFDVIVTGLDDGADQIFDVFNLDIEAAEPGSDGLLRAPRMTVEEALKKYG